MTVKRLADDFHLWQQIKLAVESQLKNAAAVDLLDKIAQIPVRRSRATRSLGAYVSKAGVPICIRLQFAQEYDRLKETFLHEVAHACDHLSRNQVFSPYRQAHGPSWRSWTTALRIPPQCSGESDAVRMLYRKRLKLVAVCLGCGAEFHRVRCLNRNRSYVHSTCGGKLQTV